MKVVVPRAELLSHRKCLLIAKPPKKLSETAHVAISASEKLSVTGLGFSYDMACRSLEWGTVSLPYRIWRRLIEDMVPVLTEEEISIAAETFSIEFAGTKVEHPEIRVRRMDKLSLEVPADAKPIEIVEYAMGKDIRVLRGSIAWKAIQPAIGQVRRQIERACSPLRRYGVTERDLAMLVAEKRGIGNAERFFSALFPD